MGCSGSLLAACPGLNGCIAAVLEGGLGRAVADDFDGPNVDCLHGSFRFFASEPPGEWVEKEMGPSLVVNQGVWEDLPGAVAGDPLPSYRRVPFAAVSVGSRALTKRLPAGLWIHRVTEADIAEYHSLAATLAENFPGH